MSARTEPGWRELLSKAWANDTVKILAVLALLYASYLLMGGILGFSFRGQLNSLARVTFLIAIYALMALALNLQWGYTGLFNIGLAGFFAVGLYTMAMVSKPPVTGQGAAQIGGLGLPIWVGVLAGMTAAALLGFVVALPALRLRADYLAIVTIAMSEIVRFIYMSSTFQSVTLNPVVIKLFGAEFTLFSRLLDGGTSIGTGGGRGLILNYDDPLAFLLDSGPYESFVALFEPLVEGTIAPVIDGFVYAVILLVVFVVAYYWLLRRIGQSPFGRVLKAIREDEQVANALGKNTASFKIKSFMVGCALLGLAGILWQWRQGAVTPNSFRPKLTFYVWVALIIGGAGSNTGSVLGGAIFAAVLFQGPRYVKNVVNEVYQLDASPNTIASALGPALDPLLLFGSDLLNAIPVLVFLGVVVGVIYGVKVAYRDYRDEIVTRIDAPDKYETGVRVGLWLAALVVVLVPFIVLDLVGGDFVPFAAYTLNNINSLQLVLMGVVLVIIVQVRPEGLLGHRKEVASSVPLLDKDDKAIRPRPAADGGEKE